MHAINYSISLYGRNSGRCQLSPVCYSYLCWQKDILIAEGNGCCIETSYKKKELFYFNLNGEAFKYYGPHADPEVPTNSAQRPKSRGRTQQLYDKNFPDDAMLRIFHFHPFAFLLEHSINN